MRDNNLQVINDKYSGGGQDIFVMEIFGEDYYGTFVDIGAREPINHNNTFMLEENGWRGIALDIENYEQQWKFLRKTPFIWADAIMHNFADSFYKYNLNSPIDFLSLDVEGRGDRVAVLKNILKTNYEFKVITIEHDAYRGLQELEMIPQRQILTELGYKLVAQDDECEDWWVNPKYVAEEKYNKFISVNKEKAFELLKNAGVDFERYYK